MPFKTLSKRGFEYDRSNGIRMFCWHYCIPVHLSRTVQFVFASAVLAYYLAGSHHQHIERSVNTLVYLLSARPYLSEDSPCYGHVSRMPPSADAYKAIYQDIPSVWRRPPGRPWESWLATIHRDLRQLDIDLNNVPELAAGRLLWRRLIRGATHHSGACYWRWLSPQSPASWLRRRQLGEGSA